MTMTHDRPIVAAALTDGPGVEVTGPPVVPYRHGLFSVAPPVTSGDPHEGHGLSWLSTACGNALGSTQDPCLLDADADPLERNDACSWRQFVPFWVYAYNTQSALAGLDAEARARDALTGGEQHGAEQALWGYLDEAVTAGAGDYVAVTGAALLHQAVAYVEQKAQQVYGGQTVLHMSRFTASLLDELRVDGSVLRTRVGSAVVAGAGYDDPLADDLPTTVSIIGTGALVLRQGPILTYPNQIDRSRNDASVLAMRNWRAGWDCTAVGVTVTL